MAKIPEKPTNDGRIWGRALRSTPDEIVEAARITDQDVESAGRLWERAAPDELKKLLGKKKRPKKG
jgi:hypothetical protein